MSNYLNRLYPLQSLKLWSKAIFTNKKTTTYRSPQMTATAKDVESIFEKIDRSTLDFSLHRKPSTIPNAGTGVFLNGASQKAGSIMSFYPGTLYLPSDPILFVSLSNEYILKCFDGIYVDGKPTGLSGRVYNSIYKRENWPGAIQISDATWMQPRQLSNPLAVGQFVNNGTNQYKPNVCYFEIDLPSDFPMHLKKYIPNMYWNTSVYTDDIRVVALIALQDISHGQELFSTYMDIVK